MNPRITPEIAEALMRRRAGGVGGGNTTPALGQTLQVSPMGGPTGAPSQSPLPQQPQPMPVGVIPGSQQPQMQQMPQQQSQQPQAQQRSAGQQQQSAVGGDRDTRNLMKALMQRLIQDL